MFESVFGADMPLWVRFTIAGCLFGLIVVGIGVFIRWAFKFPRTKKYAQLPPPPVRIAHIVESVESGGGVASAAVLLVIASAGSAFMFLSSTTILQEIAALLVWTGNGVFWGVIMITASLSRRRTYIVYRDVGPSE